MVPRAPGKRERNPSTGASKKRVFPAWWHRKVSNQILI